MENKPKVVKTPYGWEPAFWVEEIQAYCLMAGFAKPTDGALRTVYPTACRIPQ